MSSHQDPAVTAFDVTVPSGPPAASPVAEIRAALERGDELAALDVLGLALHWSADVMRGDAAGTPAAAFRAVAMADRALVAVPAFSAALESLVESSEPAAEVAQDLARYARRLAELDRDMASQRERLSELLDAEDRLRAEAARKDEISAQIAELERIEQLAARVAELRRQHGKLAERTKTVAAAVTSAEARLATSAEPLLTLTGNVLEHLAVRTRELLVRADEQDRLLQARIAEQRQAAERFSADAERRRAELAEAEAEVAREQARYERLCAEVSGRMAALRRYQAANRAVADALAGRAAIAGQAGTAKADPVADAVRALDDVQERLAKIDTRLGSALAADKGELPATSLQPEPSGGKSSGPGAARPGEG